MREKPLILLIDDEDKFLEIASVKLESGGFEVVITHNVNEALSKAAELQPDVILSDIYMPPGPNGWQFALAVRKDPRIKDIKFAFFTSLRDPTMELKPSERSQVLSELKDVPFFSKIDDVDVLDKKVRSLL
jgi:CheY-like chemotaxis protein